MIQAVIIDDEAPARDIILEYLEEYPDIEVIAESGDGFSGLKLINEKKPDLVFLDVQMPKLTGFEMLEVLDDKPAIIFTTAYDQYALKAFEQNAVDYLLKPFSYERFKKAVDKALAQLHTGSIANIEQSLGEFQLEKEGFIPRVVVKTKKEIRILPVNTIDFFEAQDDYVLIYAGQEKFLKQKTMKFYENHLNPMDFIRVHRSFIVRSEKISRIESYEKSSYVLILKDNRKIPVSRSGYNRLKEILQL